MAEVLPFPRRGDLFVDARGPERTMRISHHPERELLVVSLWSGLTCRASFQLPLTEVAKLSELLGTVMAAATTAAAAATGPVAAAEADGPAGVPPENLPQAS